MLFFNDLLQLHITPYQTFEQLATSIFMYLSRILIGLWG